jgi:hypothetical protein
MLNPLAFNSAERVKYELTGDKDVKYLGEAICLGYLGYVLTSFIVLGEDLSAPFSAASLS